MARRIHNQPAPSSCSSSRCVLMCGREEEVEVEVLSGQRNGSVQDVDVQERLARRHVVCRVERNQAGAMTQSDAAELAALVQAE